MGSLRGLKSGGVGAQSQVVPRSDRSTYQGLFDSFESLVSQFGIPEDEASQLRRNAEMIFAIYEEEDYEGSAYVLYKEGNKYFEVYSSHNSCYGLEDQWSPEETSLDILKRLIDENKHQFSNAYYSSEGKRKFTTILESEFSLYLKEAEVTEEDDSVITIPSRGRKRNKKAFEYRTEDDGVIRGRNRKSFKM